MTQISAYLKLCTELILEWVSNMDFTTHQHDKPSSYGRVLYGSVLRPDKLLFVRLTSRNFDLLSRHFDLVQSSCWKKTKVKHIGCHFILNWYLEAVNHLSCLVRWSTLHGQIMAFVWCVSMFLHFSFNVFAFWTTKTLSLPSKLLPYALDSALSWTVILSALKKALARISPSVLSMDFTDCLIKSQRS